MKLRALIVAVSLMVLPIIGNATHPGGSTPVTGVPGMEMLNVEPGEIAEIPFYALIQVPAPLDAFWYKFRDGISRLCVRMPAPVGPNTIGFAGYCFTLEEISDFPTLTPPAIEPEVVPEDES